MAGNVREWLADWYSSTYYDEPSASQADPTGPEAGEKKVVRGGAWASIIPAVRVSNRAAYKPNMDGNIYSLGMTGIRCGKTFTANENDTP
jgi:formylglycine-generating enzyme required for sulfatase activity